MSSTTSLEATSASSVHSRVIDIIAMHTSVLRGRNASRPRSTEAIGATRLSAFGQRSISTLRQASHVDVFDMLADERQALADLLDQLTTAQLTAPSLCHWWFPDSHCPSDCCSFLPGGAHR